MVDNFKGPKRDENGNEKPSYPEKIPYEGIDWSSITWTMHYPEGERMLKSFSYWHCIAYSRNDSRAVAEEASRKRP